MTRISVWVRSLREYPLIILYSLRHTRHMMQAGANDTQEKVAATLGYARKYALRTLNKPLPLSNMAQRERLIEFYERYEDLVDVLCSAARYEDPSSFELEYARQREWMQKHYPEIRPYLIAHLKLDPADDSFGLRCVGKPTDAFEALYVAPSLADALYHDDGDLIERIDRTRSALNRYGDHLRRKPEHRLAR